MYSRIVFFAVLLPLTFALGACKSKKEAQNADSSKQTAAMNGSYEDFTKDAVAWNQETAASQKVGSFGYIAIVENATTGYRWEVAAQNKKQVEIVGDKNFELPSKNGQSNEGMVGVPTNRVFRLKALAKGDGELKMVYRRSFDKEGSPADTAVFKYHFE